MDQGPAFLPPAGGGGSEEDTEDSQARDQGPYKSADTWSPARGEGTWSGPYRPSPRVPPCPSRPAPLTHFTCSKLGLGRHPHLGSLGNFLGVRGLPVTSRVRGRCPPLPRGAQLTCCHHPSRAGRVGVSLLGSLPNPSCSLAPFPEWAGTALRRANWGQRGARGPGGSLPPVEQAHRPSLREVWRRGSPFESLGASEPPPGVHSWGGGLGVGLQASPRSSREHPSLSFPLGEGVHDGSPNPETGLRTAAHRQGLRGCRRGGQAQVPRCGAQRSERDRRPWPSGRQSLCCTVPGPRPPAQVKASTRRGCTWLSKAGAALGAGDFPAGLAAASGLRGEPEAPLQAILSSDLKSKSSCKVKF